MPDSNSFPYPQLKLYCPGCGGMVWPEARSAPLCDYCFEKGYVISQPEPEPKATRKPARKETARRS